MMRYFLALFTALSIAGIQPAGAQETKRQPDPATDKMKVEDTKPQKFDIFFRVKEEKFDTNNIKGVVQAFMARLNSSNQTPNKDYSIFLGHDTIQVRFMTNKRDVSDWYSLLVRQGVLRIHLANDSMYFVPVDTANVPKGYVIVPDPDMKTKHYVYDRILNGQLMQLNNSIEQFDTPTLNGVVVPKDTAFKSFLFTKGMRFAVVIDGVVYTTASVSSDSAAINMFPILTQYPAALTYIMDRVVRFPLIAPVDFLGWRKTEDR